MDECIYINDKKLFDKLIIKSNDFSNWKFDSSSKYNDGIVDYYEWQIFEFDWFVNYLNELGKLSNDDLLYIVDLNSTNQSNKLLFEQHGILPSVQFKLPINLSIYQANIGIFFKNKLNINEFLFSFKASNKLVFFPPSLKWHIFCDYELELARLHSTVGVPNGKPYHMDYIEQEEALRRIGLLNLEK
jgi:hypothetical protein